MSKDEKVVVLESADPIEVDLACSLLRGGNIPFEVEGSNASGLSVFAGSAFRSMQTVLVREQDGERALALLEEAWGDPKD